MKSAYEFVRSPENRGKSVYELLVKFAAAHVEESQIEVIKSAQKVYQVSPLSHNKLIGQSEIAQIAENYIKKKIR